MYTWDLQWVATNPYSTAAEQAVRFYRRGLVPLVAASGITDDATDTVADFIAAHRGKMQRATIFAQGQDRAFAGMLTSQVSSLFVKDPRVWTQAFVAVEGGDALEELDEAGELLDARLWVPKLQAFQGFAVGWGPDGSALAVEEAAWQAWMDAVAQDGGDEWLTLRRFGAWCGWAANALMPDEWPGVTPRRVAYMVKWCSAGMETEHWPYQLAYPDWRRMNERWREAQAIMPYV